MQNRIARECDRPAVGLRNLVENSHEGGSQGQFGRVVSAPLSGTDREPSRWNPTIELDVGVEKARGYYSRSAGVDRRHTEARTGLAERGQYWSQLLPFSIGWNVGLACKPRDLTSVRISEKIEIPELMWRDVLFVVGRISHREIKESDISDMISVVSNRVIQNGYYGVDRKKFRVETIVRAVQAATYMVRHNDNLVRHTRETFGSVQIGEPVLKKAYNLNKFVASSLIDKVFSHWLFVICLLFPALGLAAVTAVFSCIDGWTESFRDLGKLDEDFVLDVHGLVLAVEEEEVDGAGEVVVPPPVNNNSSVVVPALVADEVEIDLRAPRESQSQSAQASAAGPSVPDSSPTTTELAPKPAPRNVMRTEGSAPKVSTVTDAILTLSPPPKAIQERPGVDLAVVVQQHADSIQEVRPMREIKLADLLPAFGDRAQAIELGNAIALPDDVRIPKLVTRLEPDNTVIGGSVVVKEVTPLKDRVKVGEFYHVGPACAYLLPVAFSTNSKHNEVVALTRRHLNKNHDLAMPKNVTIVSYWNTLSQVSAPLFAEYAKRFKEVVGFREWLDGQKPVKRELYMRALNTGCMSEVLVANGKRWHERGSFLKDELRLQDPDKPATAAKPRLIQGLQYPFIQGQLGWWCSTVAKIFKDNFLFMQEADGTVRESLFSFSSGKSPVEMGEWYGHYKRQGYTFFENDFSSFDSTQSIGCHKAEKAVYELFADVVFREWDNGLVEGKGVRSCWEQAYDFQRDTKGRTRFYKYECVGTRKSGDPNTSVGNTIINCMSNYAAVKKYLGRVGGGECRIMAVGDDCLIAVKLSDTSKLEGMVQSVESYMTKLGLESKFKYSGETPTYCSMIAVEALVKGISTFVWVPEITKRLQKVGFTVNPLKKGETPAQRMFSELNSVEAKDYCPIYSHLANAYKTVAGGKVSVGDGTLVHMPRSEERVTLEKGSDWTLRYYGISMGEVESFGRKLSDMILQTRGGAFYYRDEAFESAWRHFNGLNPGIPASARNVAMGKKALVVETEAGSSNWREPKSVTQDNTGVGAHRKGRRPLKTKSGGLIISGKPQNDKKA